MRKTHRQEAQYSSKHGANNLFNRTTNPSTGNHMVGDDTKSGSTGHVLQYTQNSELPGVIRIVSTNRESKLKSEFVT